MPTKETIRLALDRCTADAIAVEIHRAHADIPETNAFCMIDVALLAEVSRQGRDIGEFLNFEIQPYREALEQFEARQRTTTPELSDA